MTGIYNRDRINLGKGKGHPVTGHEGTVEE